MWWRAGEEGVAARGRSGDARGCDGGSEVIARRPEETIWSGSSTAVFGNGSISSSLSPMFRYFCLVAKINYYKIYFFVTITNLFLCSGLKHCKLRSILLPPSFSLVIFL
jgi:hypothetical protein